MPKQEIKLISKKQETPDIITFRFSCNMDFKAGQYITMFLPVDDPRGNSRPFTISSSPEKKGYIEISTKISESPFKQFLNSLENGSKVDIIGPMGKFTFQDDKERPAVMIAGGIGITPFRSIITYLTETGSKAEVILLYSNKIPEEIAFKKELEELEKNNRNLCVIYTITRPSESKEQWTGNIGRIDAGFIGENADVEKSIFYVCGPPAMVDAMQKTLEELQVQEERIRLEKFTGY